MGQDSICTQPRTTVDTPSHVRAWSLRDWIGLGSFIAVCFGAASLGSIFTKASVNGWYVGLQKPSWNPPGWVFGPVWSALYLSMGVSVWLVWRRRGLSGAARPLGLFALQLALNVAWSGLFFGLRMPGAALAEIVLLWGAILATALSFRWETPLAGWLLAPYLLWVAFAAVLNLALWKMN